MDKFIYADKFFLRNSIIEKKYLRISRNKFAGFYNTPTDSSEIIRYDNCWVTPGFVDTHIHGFAGFDIMDASADGLYKISEGLVKYGVTSFLPTTLTAKSDEIKSACAVIAENAKHLKGAKVAGIYLEGPFFTEKYKGAQNPAYFCDPSVELLNEWQVAAKGLICKIAIAPERDGTEKFIRYAESMGITVALGHSDATYDQARAATTCGAKVFVHTYNGMRPLSHREPGMVGAALNLGSYAEVICDGFHVSPVAINLLYKSIGAERVVMISDCMRAGGMPEGEYMLGEFPTIVKNGSARLSDGTLAGSILTFEQAIKNMRAWDITTVQNIIKMATSTPADSVGINCGEIKMGLDADFVVLSPELDVLHTYIDGECKYSKK